MAGWRAGGSAETDNRWQHQHRLSARHRSINIGYRSFCGGQWRVAAGGGTAQITENQNWKKAVKNLQENHVLERNNLISDLESHALMGHIRVAGAGGYFYVSHFQENRSGT